MSQRRKIKSDGKGSSLSQTRSRIWVPWGTRPLIGTSNS